MTEQESLIKNIYFLIEKSGITQRELAEHIGVTEVTISRYLSGERMPRIEILSKIAEFFDASVDFLLGRINVNLINKDTSGFHVGLSKTDEELLTYEDKEKIKEYAQFIIDKRKNEK